MSERPSRRRPPVPALPASHGGRGTARPRGLRKGGLFLLSGCLYACIATATAQEYSRFLSCAGTVVADSKPREAYIDLALRINNRKALIQGSNVLPVGEILDFVPTPANYSMTYLLRPRGTKVVTVPGWFQNTILIFYPDVQRLNQIRLSVNRQTGVLEGKMLNEDDEMLGAFTLQCRSQSEKDIGPAKF